MLIPTIQNSFHTTACSQSHVQSLAHNPAEYCYLVSNRLDVQKINSLPINFERQIIAPYAIFIITLRVCYYSCNFPFNIYTLQSKIHAFHYPTSILVTDNNKNYFLNAALHLKLIVTMSLVKNKQTNCLSLKLYYGAIRF
jgi:hypothetical protein